MNAIARDVTGIWSVANIFCVSRVVSVGEGAERTDSAQGERRTERAGARNVSRESAGAVA